MTRKIKKEPLISHLDHVLSEAEYIKRNAERLAKEILERAREEKKQ